jgi:hypothetical protein
MIRIKVLRVGTAAGAAAMSSLVAASAATTLGCTVEADDEATDVGVSEETALSPGSARLELQFGGPQLAFALAASTTDEFVRVGEVLAIDVPAWLAWDELHPNDAMPDDARLSQLRGTLTVAYYDKGKKTSTAKLDVSQWKSSIYGLTAATKTFKPPKSCDELRFSFTLKDLGDPKATLTLDESKLGTVHVFGGELPNKTLFFDNDSGKLRTRVVEGGDLHAGSSVLLGYSDWRADQLVDRLTLGTQIGTALVNGRFGQVTIPIYGKLQYEVRYAVSYDKGQTFSAEQVLPANGTSLLTGLGRTDYETTLAVPANTSSLWAYFHVKATLVADYGGYQNVTQKWYADGQNVVLKDVYDNPNGAYSNYELLVRP